MPQCGASSRWYDVCRLAAGHRELFHEANHKGRVVRWAVTTCSAPCPHRQNWECSLDAGHYGEHQAWGSHLIYGEGDAPEERWPAAPLFWPLAP